MMAGRPPKPRGAKVLMGTFRKCRDNPDEPESAIIEGIPEPPRELEGDARVEWDSCIEYVVRNRIIGPEGLSLLVTYCNLRAAIIRKERAGLISEVPASTIAQCRALAESFGLTGSSRAKLHVSKPKQEANPWEALK